MRQTIDIRFFDQVRFVVAPRREWPLDEAVREVVGAGYPLPEILPAPETLIPRVGLLRLTIPHFPRGQVALIKAYFDAPDGLNHFEFLWLVVETGAGSGPSRESLEEASLALHARNIQDELLTASTPEQVRAAVAAAGKPAARKRDEGTVVGRTGWLFGGVWLNILQRRSWYPSDFIDGFHSKVIAAVLFMFFACMAPAVAFGGLIAAMTGDQIGVVEMIVASAVCGVVYALSSGQPLTILGSTGPVVIFIGLFYDLCARWNTPFLPALAWVGIWTALILILLAATEASRLIRVFTRFTDEIFAGLIALIFIVEAVTNSLRGFSDPDVAHDSALLTLLLALGTYVIARELSRFRSGPYLSHRTRQFFADFGPTLAIVIMSIAAFAMHPVSLERLRVPETFATTSGRPWLVDLGASPLWVILGAIVPAVLVSLLLFLDQNITVRLVNSGHHQLRKGFGYHLDMLVLGLLVGICSVFGLPWMVAATVRSLNHVQSLANFDRGAQNRILSVLENRVSGAAIHLLMASSLLFLNLLHAVPMPVLYGLFFYMGVSSMRGNQFFERLRLWFMDPSRYPAAHYLRRVPRKIVHRFTAVQALLLGVLWVVKTSVLGILFPLIIALLVPVRFALNRYFKPVHLAYLDGLEKPEEEAYREIGP